MTDTRREKKHEEQYENKQPPIDPGQMKPVNMKLMRLRQPVQMPTDIKTPLWSMGDEKSLSITYQLSGTMVVKDGDISSIVSTVDTQGYGQFDHPQAQTWKQGFWDTTLNMIANAQDKASPLILGPHKFLAGKDYLDLLMQNITSDWIKEPTRVLFWHTPGIKTFLKENKEEIQREFKRLSEKENTLDNLKRNLETVTNQQLADYKKFLTTVIPKVHQQNWAGKAAITRDFVNPCLQNYEEQIEQLKQDTITHFQKIVSEREKTQNVLMSKSTPGLELFNIQGTLGHSLLSDDDKEEQKYDEEVGSAHETSFWETRTKMLDDYLEGRIKIHDGYYTLLEQNASKKVSQGLNYRASIMLDDVEPQKGIFYARKKEGEDALEYVVLAPFTTEENSIEWKPIPGVITQQELGSKIPEPFNLKALNELLPSVLSITATRKQTQLTQLQVHNVLIKDVKNSAIGEFRLDNLRDKDGNTLLFHAQVELQKALYYSKTHKNEKTREKCIEKVRYIKEIIRQLIGHGATFSAVNQAGENPKQYADTVDNGKYQTVGYHNRDWEWWYFCFAQTLRALPVFNKNALDRRDELLKYFEDLINESQNYKFWRGFSDERDNELSASIPKYARKMDALCHHLYHMRDDERWVSSDSLTYVEQKSVLPIIHKKELNEDKVMFAKSLFASSSTSGSSSYSNSNSSSNLSRSSSSSTSTQTPAPRSPLMAFSKFKTVPQMDLLTGEQPPEQGTSLFAGLQISGVNS